MKILFVPPLQKDCNEKPGPIGKRPKYTYGNHLFSLVFRESLVEKTTFYIIP
jgi:hypothetical protein